MRQRTTPPTPSPTPTPPREDEDKRVGHPLTLWEVVLEDGKAFWTLIMLYAVQGAPLGITMGALSFLLKRSFSFSAMGLFSMATYPYSIKVLWAPLVDAFFVGSWGRRKTWIIPMQTLSGLLMIALSQYSPLILLVDGPHVHSPDPASSLPQDSAPMWVLTILFFLLVLITATQDIAVDGWALTLLQRRNRGYASTCQSIGLNIGFFVSFTLLLALHSPEFCNAYLRSPEAADPHYGLWTISGYLLFVGIAYLAVTAILLLFIRERKEDIPESEKGWSGALDIYRVLFSLFSLPHFLSLVAVLLTLKLGYVADDAVTALKLMENGFKTEDLALVAVLAFPCSIFFAMLAGRWASGPNPFKLFAYAWGLRMALATIDACVVYAYPSMANPDGSAGSGLYLFIIILSLSSSLASSFMFVCMGAFFARIADPKVGGTYLTVLNTLSNLGGTWPKALVMSGVDLLSFNGLDGYYVVMAISLVAGISVFLLFIQPTLYRLSTIPPKDWTIRV